MKLFVAAATAATVTVHFPEPLLGVGRPTGEHTDGEERRGGDEGREGGEGGIRKQTGCVYRRVI